MDTFLYFALASTRDANDRISFNDLFMIQLYAFVVFAGAIPSELGGLSSLVALDLTYNRLNGESVRRLLGFRTHLFACFSK